MNATINAEDQSKLNNERLTELRAELVRINQRIVSLQNVNKNLDRIIKHSKKGN